MPSLDNVINVPDRRLRDVVGRQKVTLSQNIYEADFEYGLQPLRWEVFTAGGATVTHLPSEGGVRLRLTTAIGDVAIRQSRPYHRYQPGKTMFMASAVLFGNPFTNQMQRVGFFDDGNGCFFEQLSPTPSNPSGIGVTIRSDAGAGNYPSEIRIPLEQWNGNDAIIKSIDWSRIQMIWLEYAWYGAGAIRFGCYQDGEPHILHQIAYGNRAGQTRAWSRTGNLPVRYEQRNIPALANPLTVTGDGVTGTIVWQLPHALHAGVSLALAGFTPSGWNGTYIVQSVPNERTATIANTSATATVVGTTTGTPVASTSDMIHYGVSVMVEGRVDDQRGFTYSHGMPPTSPLRPVSGGSRFPVLSVRGRIMGTVQESNTATGGSTTTLVRTGAGWITNQWRGLYAYAVSGPGIGQVARIVANDATTLIVEHNILPGNALGTAFGAGTVYQIGLPNRGQLLPRQLFVQSSAVCVVELIASIPTSPVVLTGGVGFVASSTLGSPNSFAERDVTATAMSGGEVVFAFVSPNNQLQIIDLQNLFALFSNIRGNATDILTLAVTGTANVGAHLVCQEAMS